MFSQKISFTAFGLLLTFSLVSAQACTPDILVDDFSANRKGALPGETLIRDLNLLGGDYGKSAGDTMTYEINTQERYIELTAGKNAPENNFFFGKFDAEACYDIPKHGVKAISFDLEAPAGTSFSMTLTQKTPDCKDRVPGQSDSTYVPITKYVTPNGTKQSVVVPFSDFATNLQGQPFDMNHLKDWTIVGVTPEGAKLRISNLVLKGDCPPGTPISSAPASQGTAPAASTTSAAGKVTALPITSTTASATQPTPPADGATKSADSGSVATKTPAPSGSAAGKNGTNDGLNVQSGATTYAVSIAAGLAIALVMLVAQ